MLPFSQHAALAGQYEQFIGGGAPMATLTFPSLANLCVPVTHTQIDVDWILSNGLSPITTIERCEFRSSLISANFVAQLVKGLSCFLVVKQGATPQFFQLWNGGLMEGGEIYRFRLVDGNYHG